MSFITTFAAEHRSVAATSPTPVGPERRSPQVRPPLRLVEAPAPARRVRVGLVGSIAFVLILVGVFALAAMHTLVVQAQFEIDRLEQNMAERQGMVDSLRLEVATLEAPAHVARAAAELGMVNPSERVHLEPVVDPVASATPLIDRS